MRRYSLAAVAFLAGAVTLIALPVNAQTCFGGLASTRTSHAIGASASAAGAQRAMVGSYDRFTEYLTVGARLGIGGSSFSTSNTSVMGATIAVSPSGSRARQAQWCPYAQVSHERGSFGYGVLRSSAGLAIGRDFQASHNITLVPFAQSAFVHVAQGTTAGNSFSNALGEFGVGLGVRLGDQLSITPSMRAFTGNARAPFREPVYSLGFQFGMPR